MKNVKMCIALFVIALSSFNCSSDDNSSSKSEDPNREVTSADIYIAVNKYNDDDSVTAYIYNNGNLMLLDNNSRVEDVILHNGVIHAVGSSLIEGQNYATHWVNGERTILTENPTDFYLATSIVAAGNNIYITGGGSDVNDAMHTVYCKNGVITKLTSGTDQSMPGSSTIHKGDVYTAGIIAKADNTGGACYWKNGGITITLGSAGQINYATSIAFGKNNVMYTNLTKLGTSENDKSQIYYLKGNEQIMVTDGSYHAFSRKLVLHDDSIYFGGYAQNLEGSNKRHACIWKDGVQTFYNTANTPSNITDLKVVSNTVYAVGSTYNENDLYDASPKFWINSVEQNIFPANFVGEAKAIYIK